MQRFYKKLVLFIKPFLMKKAVQFYFLLVLMPVRLFCQADSQAVKNGVSAKHELGMNLYAFSVRPGDFYSQYRNRIDNYLFNGLYYKRYYGRSAMRYSINYFQRLINFGNSFNGTYFPSRTFQAAIGYQRLLGKSLKTVPYVFADISYSSLSEVRGGESYYNYPYYLSSSLAYYPYYDTYAVQTFQGAVSPGIGLRIHLGKNVALTMETALQFFYQVENHSYRSIGVSARPFQCQIGFMF
jgi:hypothetical protein